MTDNVLTRPRKPAAEDFVDKIILDRLEEMKKNQAGAREILRDLTEGASRQQALVLENEERIKLLEDYMMQRKRG